MKNQRIKILIILLIILLAVFYFGKSAKAAKIQVGHLWGYNADCQQSSYTTRNSWFLSVDAACNPASGVNGRYVINYEIFVSATLWDHNTDTYTGTLLDLKNWVTANYASYGYANADAAFEDCFMHLKTGETPVTAGPMMGGNITVQPYDPNNPKPSRIPGPWGNPSGPNEWMMNIRAPIYLAFWTSKLANYTGYDGFYWDTLGPPGWVNTTPAGGLSYSKTKEFANDTDTTYWGLIYNFLDATKTVMHNQGKLVGGNVAYSNLQDGTGDGTNYPLVRDHLDFIIREFTPQVNTPSEWYEAEFPISKNALVSNPSLRQIYNPQYLIYDDRAKMTILAGYYIVQNANTVMLVTNNGASPANEMWADAWAYDIGTASGNAYEFAIGTDGWTGCDLGSTPWIVLGRQYSNALVLWRGVPHTWWGTTCGNYPPSDTSMTTKTISLGGTYRPLNADGTLGSPITTIDLKNWEGAVLIKSNAAPDTIPPAAPTGVNIS